MKSLNGVVGVLLARPVHCEHMEEWPTVAEIRSGAIYCPFCLVDKLSRILSEERETRAKINAEDNRKIEQLNRSNTELQKLAMDLLRTAEDAERLRQINQAQYD